MEKINLFYSYSHKDEKFRESLETHLSLLARNGKIADWHDRKITAGSEWKKQINDNIRSADIILLLISSDFIASDYCYEKELEIALELHESKKSIVIPIILRPADWMETSFSRLQALPTDAKAITTWENEDSAWLNVVDGIKDVINQINQLRERKHEKNEFHSVNTLLQAEVQEIGNVFRILYERSTSTRGLPTGFTDLDAHLDGLQFSELTVIAGRPEMGKSDLSLQISANIAVNEKIPVAYFSFDITANRLIRKLLISEARIPSHIMAKGNLDERHWPELSVAVGKIKDAPLFIDDSISLSFEELKDKALKMIESKKVKLIVIDGIETLIFNEQEKNSKISSKDIIKRLSLLAKSCNISILVTANVDRQVEKRSNKRPLLNDISAIGSLDEIAEKIIFLYRDKIYNDETEMGDFVEVIISKNTLMPDSIGTLHLKFLSKFSRFENATSKN